VGRFGRNGADWVHSVKEKNKINGMEEMVWLTIKKRGEKVVHWVSWGETVLRGGGTRKICGADATLRSDIKKKESLTMRVQGG